MRARTYLPLIRRLAARLRERLSRARVYVGAGCHDWLITEPREFTRAVLAFASGQGELPSPSP